MKLRERERKKKIALKSVLNAPFENEVFVDGEKVKGAVISKEGSKELR